MDYLGRPGNFEPFRPEYAQFQVRFDFAVAFFLRREFGKGRAITPLVGRRLIGRVHLKYSLSRFFFGLGNRPKKTEEVFHPSYFQSIMDPLIHAH